MVSNQMYTPGLTGRCKNFLGTKQGGGEKIWIYCVAVGYIVVDRQTKTPVMEGEKKGRKTRRSRLLINLIHEYLSCACAVRQRGTVRNMDRKYRRSNLISRLFFPCLPFRIFFFFWKFHGTTKKISRRLLVLGPSFSPLPGESATYVSRLDSIYLSSATSLVI